MKKTKYLLSAWLIFLLILNLLPFFWIDVWYDNLSYIGNQLHHPLYLLAWSASTALLLYVETKQIFERNQVRFPWLFLRLTSFLMILSCIIPYSSGIYGWLDDFHVWSAILGTAGYCLIWIILYFFPYRFCSYLLQPLAWQILLVCAAAFLCICLAGHVNALSEMVFSVGIPMLLYKELIRNN